MKYEISIDTSNEEETIKIAENFSEVTQIGDFICLEGTLGMGKSVFARGFIKYQTNAEEVPSPTFTLVQSYEGKSYDIFHYDLYRIKKAEEIFEIGMEDMIYEGVSLVEWPNKMEAYLPKNRIEISISGKDDNRKITFKLDDKNKFELIKNFVNKL
jgi:tRNA threonylcarbamoyl adenosine modification protein YjeE